MGGSDRTVSKSGFEAHYAVNCLGHFYLTYLLREKLLRSSFFRIVNTTSIANYLLQTGESKCRFTNLKMEVFS